LWGIFGTPGKKKIQKDSLFFILLSQISNKEGKEGKWKKRNKETQSILKIFDPKLKI
jgi:hypothetical protein